MTAFVDADTVALAHERAQRLPMTATERHRWACALEYAAGHATDPATARAQELAAVLGLAGRGTADVLAAAGTVLAANVSGDATAEAKEVRHRCLAWFDDDVHAAAPLLDLFTGHHRDPLGGPAPVDPELVARLRPWLAERVGRPLEIEAARVISGGFSRLMLDVSWTGGRGVVRIEQDGMFATEGRREVAVMRAVLDAGYPVPAVLWEEPDPAVLGNPFFVMEFVVGEARADDTGIDDVLRSLATLHRLGRHTTDRIAALDGASAGTSAAELVEAQLRHWHEVYRAAVRYPIPLLERGFAWLRAHLAPTGPPVVVHGDPGPGNLLRHGGGVSAVIDWEFAHAGDPAEDWAYLALIRGRKLAGPADWKMRIARTVGVEFDEDTWLAWEVYNNVKGACVNLTALAVFARTPRPTPDLLAIGVAVHLRFLQRVVELTGGRA